MCFWLFLKWSQLWRSQKSNTLLVTFLLVSGCFFQNIMHFSLFFLNLTEWMFTDQNVVTPHAFITEAHILYDRSTFIDMGTRITQLLSTPLSNRTSRTKRHHKPCDCLQMGGKSAMMRVKLTQIGCEAIQLPSPLLARFRSWQKNWLSNGKSDKADRQPP